MMMKRSLVLFFIIFVISGCAGHVAEKLPPTFYPGAPDEPRFQVLTTLSGEADLKPISNFEKFLLGPDLEFQGLQRPYDIATVPGKLYAVDRLYKKIVVVDYVEKTISIFKDDLDKEGVLRYPSGIWISPGGVKYVADIGRKDVVVYDLNDRYLRTYGGEDIFERPSDVAVYGDNVYVCDVKKNRVFIFNRVTGELKGEIGAQRDDPNYLFQKPTHVTVDEEGFLYVTDAFNFTVKQFTPDGLYVKQWGEIGDMQGQFARPKGIAVDREGNLYCVDAASDRVQVFNREGQLLLGFGGPGYKPGSLTLPAGLHIDYDNIEYFRNFIDEDFDVKYLVYASSLSGEYKITVYARGDWARPELKDEVAPEE